MSGDATRQRLGTVTVPSGTLVLVDPDIPDEEGAWLEVALGTASRFEFYGVVDAFGPWIYDPVLEAGSGELATRTKVGVLSPGGSLLFVDGAIVDEVLATHRSSLSASLATAKNFCATATINGADVVLMGVPISAAGSDSDVFVERDASGGIRRVVIEI